MLRCHFSYQPEHGARRDSNRHFLAAMSALLRQPDQLTGACFWPLSSRSLDNRTRLFVLIMGANPDLERVALVAAGGRPVENRVIGHQELDPASPCRIRVVDGPVLQDEHAKALALGEVVDDIGAAVIRIAGGDRRQRLEVRLDPCARLLSPLENPRSKLKSFVADETQGKVQPMRRLYTCSFWSAACETQIMVTSRAFKCGTTPLNASAIDEQVVQPAS
jgi:hypothetical protein